MVRKAIFWTFSAQILSFGIMFGGSLIIARLLSPREMGVYALALATTGILQILAAFGVGNYLVRATTLEPHTINTAFTINAIIGVVLAAAIFGLSFVEAHFLKEPAVASVMQLMALSPLISLLDFRPSNMLQRDMRFDSLAMAGIVQSVVTTGVTIAAAWAGASYMSPAYGAVSGGAATTVLLLIIGWRYVPGGVSLRGWRPMASFGLRMMSIGGISAASARLADIIVGHFLGLAALGLYSRASNLSNMIFQNVYGTGTRVIFAKLSKDYRETGQLHDTFLTGLRLITAVMGPVLIGLAILSGPAIRVLYGERWLGAALPLSLLMIAQFITLRYAMNWELFVIRDELAIQTRLEIIRSVMILITRTIGSLFSITAAAAASIFDGVFATILYGRQINRMIHASEREMVSVSAEAVLVMAAAVTPALALMFWSGWDPATPLPLVAAAVGLGGVLWLAALAWRKHPMFHEITRAGIIMTKVLKRA